MKATIRPLTDREIDSRDFYVAHQLEQAAPVTEFGRELARMMAEWDWNFSRGLIDSRGRIQNV
jgi:hypothetical protein